MVATIIDPAVDETKRIPNTSPKKYRNGSKKASRRKTGISFKEMGFNLLNKAADKRTRGNEIISLRKIRDTGLKYSSACLYHTKLSPQHVIDTRRKK
jgi:hypothetical protein